MKKVYVQPMMAVVNVHGELPLAISGENKSMDVSGDKVNSTSNIGFVKGENRGSHTVWDDDWSE